MLEQIKNRNAPELPAIELNLIKHTTHSEFVYVGQVKGGGKHSQAKPMILEILDKEPGINQKSIGERLLELGHKIHATTLRKLLITMENAEGSITKTGGNAHSYCYFLKSAENDSHKH